MSDEEQNPVDQLIDLFVYAPVGMLYEYQEVIPKLVKRGKSQVQLARVVGKMAADRGGAETFTMVAEGMANLVNRQLVDLSQAMGFGPVPDQKDTPPPSKPRLALVASVDDEQSKSEDHGSDADERDGADHGDDGEPEVLPIARYDELTAREIIGLLDELEPSQLDRIRRHEENNRARKTVLGKLDRLAR